MLKRKERYALLFVLFLALGLLVFSFITNSTHRLFIFVVGLVMLLFILFFFYMDLRYRGELKRLNEYIARILNNQESFAIERNEEGEYSKLTNQVYKVMLNLRDTSERLKKDKNYLAESLADITHQLKTPITSMMVMSDLLKKDNLKEEEKKEFLEKLDHQVERLRWLVQSLLTISKLDAGAITYKREIYPLSEIIHEATEPFIIPMELKGIDFLLDMEESTLETDKTWLSEALMNILKNSIEHTSEGKRIGIDVKDMPFDTTITLWDEGEGIPEDALEELFARYKISRKPGKEGVGIGLAISKGIIQQLGGHIEVFSELKEGTKFVITFKK